MEQCEGSGPTAPTTCPATTWSPSATSGRTGSYVKRSGGSPLPATPTDTTPRPATGPAKATLPGAAASTGVPGGAARSTPRWPGPYGPAGGSQPRTTRGLPRPPIGQARSATGVTCSDARADADAAVGTADTADDIAAPAGAGTRPGFGACAGSDTRPGSSAPAETGSGRAVSSPASSAAARGSKRGAGRPPDAGGVAGRAPTGRPEVFPGERHMRETVSRERVPRGITARICGRPGGCGHRRHPAPGGSRTLLLAIRVTGSTSHAPPPPSQRTVAALLGPLWHGA